MGKKRPYTEILSILNEDPSKGGWADYEVRKALKEKYPQEKWMAGEVYSAVEEMKDEGYVTANLVKTFKGRGFNNLKITTEGYGLILFYEKDDKDVAASGTSDIELLQDILTTINEGHVRGKAMEGLVETVQKSHQASAEKISECIKGLKENNNFYMQEDGKWKLTESPGKENLYTFTDERYKSLYEEMQEKIAHGEPVSLVNAWGRREISKIGEEEKNRRDLEEIKKESQKRETLIKRIFWIVGIVASVLGIAGFFGMGW